MEKKTQDFTSKTFFKSEVYKKFTKEFLIGNKYQEFAEMIQKEYQLTSKQWQIILNEWEFKESVIGV